MVVSFILFVFFSFVWGRFARSSFSLLSTFPFRKQGLFSLLSVGILILFQYLIDLFSLQGSLWVGVGCGLLFLVFLILWIVFHLSCPYLLFGIRFSLFLVCGELGITWGFPLIFVFLSAFFEEFLKIGASAMYTKTYGVLPSDLLFFTLLSSIGFGVIENGYYLISSLGVHRSDMASFIAGRSIFSLLLHIIATGVIALILVKTSSGGRIKWFVGSIFSILAGVLIHLLYNISILQSIWVYLLLLVVGYFFISYLVYLSDRVYLSKT